jgi:hypothetical protein
MVHLQGTERLFISEDLIGYADKLTEDGVFSRRLDLLLMGFGHAVTNEIPPVDAHEITRHELTRAVSLGDQQLPIEAVAHWYVQKLDREVPEDEHDLLDFICRTGIAGVLELRDKWEGRSKSQIQWSILKVED